MDTCKQFVLTVLVLAMLGASARALFSKGQEDARGSKAVEFLNTSKELRGNYSYRFTGEFRPIPADLQAELNHAFPQYDFLIASLIVTLDFPPKKYDIILVADSATGEIVSYVWGDYWTLGPSKSFKWILRGQKAQTKDDAVNQVKSLARLLAYAANDYQNNEVGRVIVKSGRVWAELIRGGGVFRVIEAKVDKQFKFGALSIAPPRGLRVE